MARRRIAWAALLLLALLFQVYSEHYLAALIVYLCVGLPVLGILLSLPAMLGLRVRLAPERSEAEQGSACHWNVAVENARKLPLAKITVKVKVENQMTGTTFATRLRPFGMSGGQTVSFPVDTSHCGLQRCTLKRVTVTDCLGLLTVRRRIQGAAVLPVLPTPLDWEAPELQEEDTTAPVLHVRTGGGSGEDYDLRPYRPGDPIRLIHWKLSSKRDMLIFREILERDQARLVLTFDHFGSAEEMDCVLGRLRGLSRILLDRRRDYRVRWVHPVTGSLREFYISGEREWKRCLFAALGDPAPLFGTQDFDFNTGNPRSGELLIHITPWEEETP